MADTLIGSNLVKNLGLSKFKYIWVQKILDIPTNMFIVTVDSRFPNNYLSLSRLKKLKFTQFKKLQRQGSEYKFKNFRISPAIPLNEFSGGAMSDSVFVIRDLGGHYYMDDKLYENVNKIFKEVIIL